MKIFKRTNCQQEKIEYILQKIKGTKQRLVGIWYTPPPTHTKKKQRLQSESDTPVSVTVFMHLLSKRNADLNQRKTEIFKVFS